MTASMTSSVDIIDKVLSEFKKQTKYIDIYNHNMSNQEEDGEEMVYAHMMNGDINVEDTHLIYFDFTKHLLSNHGKNTQKKHLTKSLFKLLIRCIRKYGSHHIKIVLNIDNINIDIMKHNTNNLKKQQSIDYDLINMIDNMTNIEELLKYKIDIIYMKCMDNDIDSHFNYILKHHLKSGQLKYRKVSIIGIDHKQTTFKYLEHSLNDNQSFTATDSILHCEGEVDLDYILSELDGYYFDHNPIAETANDSNQLNEPNDEKDEFAMPSLRMPTLSRSDSTIFC